MTYKILLSGFGGQGILALGKMYAQAASACDYNVTSMPFYEGSMRGGAANTYLIISDERIKCPVISKGTADMVVAMYQRAVNEYGNFCSASGVTIVNTNLVTEYPEGMTGKLVQIPVGSLAQSMNNERSANLIMMGAMAACADEVPLFALKDVIKKQFAKKKPELVATNIKAFETGFEYVEKELANG